MPYADPIRRAYEMQRRSAKHRDIEWDFSFDGWLAVWQASGRFEQRGVLRGQYLMARRGDVGPYSASNVEIIPAEQNARDCRLNHPESTRANALKASLSRIGCGKGWTLTRRAKRPYYMQGPNGARGYYATEAEAALAYRAACQALISEGQSA